MSRATRNRIVDSGCFLLLGVAVGKTYSEHGLENVAVMLGYLVGTLLILFGVITWTNRGAHD